MNPIFTRGDYVAFMVVAPKGRLDDALFALPIFEGQLVSEVFRYYCDTYVPKRAKVVRRKNAIDDPLTLGYVFADVFVDGDAFSISTIVHTKMLWPSVIANWEDQWVFDHLRAIGEDVPLVTERNFMGTAFVQSQVADYAQSYFSRYFLIAISLYTAFIFTRDP